MALDVDHMNEGQGQSRLVLRGRLDTATAATLDARLGPMLEDPRLDTLVLDLAALDYLSSAGIRSIFRARKTLEGRGGHVVILRPQPAVQKVLDIVRALPSAQIFASTTELDRYLDAMQRRVRGDQP